ncbi:hypothetical protein [Haloprofundus salilacus]|uniref:hypothetical protein n=1 Tax=Haloprofundus salilacus TaxID=2876190 RepID=UPI001CCFEE90|nr:hypothetical protein [Haloprofundus salilacus]
MSSRETLLTYGEDCCTRLGYAVQRPESGREPDAVAEPVESVSTGDAAFVADAPVAIEPLEVDEVTPTTVLSKHADNRDRGRKTLFVVPPADRSRLARETRAPLPDLPSPDLPLVDETLAATVVELLSDPAGVRTDGGEREFHNGPDRIALASDTDADNELSRRGESGPELSGGGYALCAVARPDTQLTWREELGGGPSRDESETRVVLRADGEVVTAVDDCDELRCPLPTVFPYSYRRGSDKRMHVRDPEGVVVGSFDGVRDMREAGFEPIPMPLVPEQLFEGSVDETWAVVVAAATTDRLYTSDGARSLSSLFDGDESV